ncbi:MAG: Rho-binding antiterminator [Methyloprofundus sp.]|nr:Rho-binding antiterminator [Methyloprofundus sp.]MDT8425011.1 Rho-binding antiterminator [Methyloprofundus sp.]
MSQCYITCALHDYIEIVCMYGYQVKLQLKNGQIISGKALDIQTSVDKREYLLIDNEPQKIELTQLVKMTVLTPNAKFDEVIF